nr:DUF805 domain-containing protein [uncultured Marinifilum sp.]
MANTFPMIPMDIKKWESFSTYIKKHSEELSLEEQTAFELLNDFWRNGNFDKEECEENIRILIDNAIKHGNNLQLKTNLQGFRELCKRYYTKDPAAFKEFQRMKGGRPNESVVVPKHTVPEKKKPKEPIKKKQRIDYDDGYYIGDTKFGKPHGFGKYYYNNGDWADGGWLNGKPEGYYCKIYYKEAGRTEIGEFHSGKRWGKGKMVWDDGHKYRGEWDEDGINGYGIWVYPDKDTYKGYFKNWEMNGKGRYTWADGGWYEGDWKNDKMTGIGTRYDVENKRTDHGEYLNGNRSGKGEMKWKDGDRYVGTWQDTDKGLQGKGIYYFANGNKQRGRYKNGQWHKSGGFNFSFGSDKNTSDLGGFGRFFSPKGRLRRSGFALRMLIVSVPYVAALVSLDTYDESVLNYLFFFFSFLYFIFIGIQMAKRLHDIGYTGWLALITLVPFSTPWFQLYLLFAAGSIGDNKYGADPR